MKLFSIGFTKKTAEEFFRRLDDAGVKRVVDVRLSNNSQLARFSQADDLPYFLKKLCKADYCHEADLAPTKEIRDLVVVNGGRVVANWGKYEKKFQKLLKDRRANGDVKFKDKDCLLCSEHEAQFCHRRLVLEDFVKRHGKDDIWIEHLEPHGMSDIRIGNWPGRALIVPKDAVRHIRERAEVREKKGKGKWADQPGVAVVVRSHGAPKKEVLKSEDFHKRLKENALDDAKRIIWFTALKGQAKSLPKLHQHLAQYLESGKRAKDVSSLAKGAIRVLEELLPPARLRRADSPRKRGE